MKINVRLFFLVVLVAVVLLFLNVSYAAGWILGVLVMFVLNRSRPKFYDNLMSREKLSLLLYISYVVFTVGLIAIPALIAFMFPNVVNPYMVFAAYFSERGRKFVAGLFEKKETMSEI